MRTDPQSIPAGELRARFYVRNLRPHVWGVMRRADANMPRAVRPCSDADALVAAAGARGIGDAAARVKIREACDALNAGTDA
jgi:hypothetical protein